MKAAEETHQKNENTEANAAVKMHPWREDDTNPCIYSYSQYCLMVNQTKIAPMTLKRYVDHMGTTSKRLCLWALVCWKRLMIQTLILQPLFLPQRKSVPCTSVIFNNLVKAARAWNLNTHTGNKQSYNSRL